MKLSKKSLSKIIFEKWGKNAENRLVFVFGTAFWRFIEPLVGDFYEHFSNQEFFDSLVGQLVC